MKWTCFVCVRVSYIDQNYFYSHKTFYKNIKPSFSGYLTLSPLHPFPLSPVVNCTEPGHVENSIRQVLPSGPHRYSFQTTVSYRCNPGYYLLGTSSISCQGEGTWDRSLPKCLCEYLRFTFCCSH